MLLNHSVSINIVSLVPSCLREKRCMGSVQHEKKISRCIKMNRALRGVECKASRSTPQRHLTSPLLGKLSASPLGTHKVQDFQVQLRYSAQIKRTKITLNYFNLFQVRGLRKRDFLKVHNGAHSRVQKYRRAAPCSQ
jgi:hypothetical protein